MSIALDIGTRHLRSLRREGGRLVGRKNHAVYLALPDRPGQRRILEKASIRFATCSGSLLVIGQAAIETSEMLEAPCIPLMIDNRMPPQDPIARQVLTSLIDCLLPPSNQSGEDCWVNLPGAVDGESAERRFFSQIIRLKGYVPQLVHPGLAVALAELGRSGFTGIGCDFGNGHTRASFVHHGVELCCMSLEKGGGWIDSRLAETEGCVVWDREGHQYWDTSAIARWKKANLISVHQPVCEREQRLSLLCEELIVEALHEIGRQLAADRVVRTLKQPVPFVCSGGLSTIPGFCELLFDRVRDAHLPVAISEARSCADPDFTVTRGGLILAELAASGTNPKVA